MKIGKAQGWTPEIYQYWNIDEIRNSKNIGLKTDNNVEKRSKDVYSEFQVKSVF